MMTPELLSKIALWRQKCADNTITLDEMKEAIRLTRDSRLTAAQHSARSKAVKSGINKKSAEELLNDLGI